MECDKIHLVWFFRLSLRYILKKRFEWKIQPFWNWSRITSGRFCTCADTIRPSTLRFRLSGVIQRGAFHGKKETTAHPEHYLLGLLGNSCRIVLFSYNKPSRKRFVVRFGFLHLFGGTWSAVPVMRQRLMNHRNSSLTRLSPQICSRSFIFSSEGWGDKQ